MKLLRLFLFVAASLSLFATQASEISLSGVVVSLQKDPATQGFLVKFQGMDLPLQVARGPSYLCLRKSLNSQATIFFSFDAKSAKIQSCELSAEAKS